MPIAPISILDFFRSKANSEPVSHTRLSRLQAVATLENIARLEQWETVTMSVEVLSTWCLRLFSQGYSSSTISLYFKHLSALNTLAVKEGLLPEGDAFDIVREKLRSVANRMENEKVDTATFDKLQKLVKTNTLRSSERQLAKDVLLFAIYNGGLSFEEIISCKKNDYQSINQPIDDIISRHSRPRNKYLFALGQSVKTPRQQDDMLRHLFTGAMMNVSLEPSRNGVNHLTAAGLWGHAALRCNIAPGVVKSCLGEKAVVLPFLDFAEAVDLTPEQRQEATDTVVSSLTVDPQAWFAMQLRPRVKYDTVVERLRETEAGRYVSSIYYPMEEIARRIGRKLEFQSRPVMPGIVFIRSRMSLLAPLFAIIGNLAWCFKRSREPGSQYAVISQEQMSDFQAAIGTFTPETEILPIGGIELKENDHVEVIGGNFTGAVGTILSVGHSDTPATVYRLIIRGVNGFEWRVNSHRRMIRKISEERYNKISET